jgi:hypothetical protein
MSKIQTLHFRSRSIMSIRNTVSRGPRDCAELCGIDQGCWAKQGQARIQINVAMQLSKRLADCGLARRILTAHVAARPCWWSACLGLGIMSVPRTGLVAWPLNSCPTCKNNRHNATRYGKLAACCDASYRHGRGSCS